ncbi:MAG: aminotransferase [Rhodospirillaceae bacterium]|nr:MAG: aminotransferase [Rhodospirillaceae bacterium]
MRSANPVYAGLGTTVFETMSRLARQHQAVNLGQGFPDDRGPAAVLERAAGALLEGSNQYPPMLGLPELRQAVAAHAQRFHGVAVDWESETMVTSGATEALAAAIFSLVEPGDEVVLIEPFYDAYLPLVLRAGATPRFVSLTPPHWRLERADLVAAVSPRTKAIIVNNPMNPTGRVFDADEMALIAEIADGADAFVIADEVYEHIIFDDARHLSLLAQPGLRDRVVKLGSAGKTFSLTGWKVGYVTAAPQVLNVIAKAHQFLTFTTPPNLQVAVAYGLTQSDDYFRDLAADMQRRRDRFVAGLQRLGLDALLCQGTYFANIDIAKLGPAKLGQPDDVAFCRDLVECHGVAAIPVSAFYSARPVRSVIRFCFAKQDRVLDAALERLAGLA